LVEHTNAKGPKDFCDGYKPNVSEIPVQIIEQFVFDSSQLHYKPSEKRKHNYVYEPNQLYHQPPEHENEYFIFDTSSQYLQPRAQQHEHPTIDLNLQLSMSTTWVCPDNYASFDDKQAGTSTSYAQNDLRFDLNKSPPKD